MLSTNEQFKIFQGAKALGEMAIASEVAGNVLMRLAAAFRLTVGMSI